jgi:hypothetical protein
MSGFGPIVVGYDRRLSGSPKRITAPIKEVGGPTFTGMSTVYSETLADSIFYAVISGKDSSSL